MAAAAASLAQEARAISFLHLTDLHAGQPREANRYGNIEAAFLADLELQARAGWTWDIVFFTGDLAFRGTIDELAVASLRLQTILAKVAELNARNRGVSADQAMPHFFPVPGNHDLKRPEAEPLKHLQHRWTDPKFRREFWTDPRNPLRQEIRSNFSAYERWLELLPRPDTWVNGMLPGDFTATIDVNGISLGVVGLNGTFLHWGDDAMGKLSLNLTQLTTLVGPAPSEWARAHHFNLLLTHHPADWFEAEARKQLETEIHQHDRFDLHLFGHMHQGAHLARVAPRGYRHLVMGRSLFGAEEEGFERMHGYTMGKLIVKPSADNQSSADVGPPWTKSLELWPREAVCPPDGGWSFGEKEHAGDGSWRIHAPLGKTRAPSPLGGAGVLAGSLPGPQELGPFDWKDMHAELTAQSLIHEQVLFLSASVPYTRADWRAEAEQALVKSARKDVIVETVQALAKQAREKKVQLVFGGHPSIAAALLPIAPSCWNEEWPWLLFVQHTYFKFRQDEAARALSLFPGVKLVWVSGQGNDAGSHPGAREERALREAMLSLPELKGGVFVGGLTGIQKEFELFGEKHSGPKRYALGCGGGMAAKLLLDHPVDARGHLTTDSGPLWHSAEKAVATVFEGLKPLAPPSLPRSDQTSSACQSTLNPLTDDGSGKPPSD